MNIKTFGTDHISTYKLVINNYNVMLDFNGDKLTKEDVIDIDFIFISHEHLDHCESLINYDVVKYLKDNVRIFATETTKKIINYVLVNRMEKSGYNKTPYNYIKKLLESIEIVRFKKEVIIDDNFSFIFYRSGHTFGSSMVYLKYSGKTLLYTGDMDYVENDINRQYDIPYNMHVDYLIIDGSNFFDDDYKGVSIASVRDHIKRRKPGDVVYYHAREEKAIFYALTLASKIDNAIFVYPNSMKWYINILQEQQYQAFIKDQIILEIKEHENDNKKVNVKFTPKENMYSINYRLSLHITKNEMYNFIENFFENIPSKIYIGHYYLPENYDYNIPFVNGVLLKMGENHD